MAAHPLPHAASNGSHRFLNTTVSEPFRSRFTTCKPFVPRGAGELHTELHNQGKPLLYGLLSGKGLWGELHKQRQACHFLQLGHPQHPRFP